MKFAAALALFTILCCLEGALGWGYQQGREKGESHRMQYPDDGMYCQCIAPVNNSLFFTGWCFFYDTNCFGIPEYAASFDECCFDLDGSSFFSFYETDLICYPCFW